MNAAARPPCIPAPVDPDLAEQAVPGHGVPTQDADPPAQTALQPVEAARVSQSVLTGGEQFNRDSFSANGVLKSPRARS